MRQRRFGAAPPAGIDPEAVQESVDVADDGVQLREVGRLTPSWERALYGRVFAGFGPLAFEAIARLSRGAGAATAAVGVLGAVVLHPGCSFGGVQGVGQAPAGVRGCEKAHEAGPAGVAAAVDRGHVGEPGGAELPVRPVSGVDRARRDTVSGSQSGCPLVEHAREGDEVVRSRSAGRERVELPANHRRAAAIPMRGQRRPGGALAHVEEHSVVEGAVIGARGARQGPDDLGGCPRGYSNPDVSTAGAGGLAEHVRDRQLIEDA